MQLEHILAAHGLIGRGGKSKPLPTIQSFIGSSNDLGTQIILNWTNPTVIEFQKTQIFMSSIDISNLSYEDLVLSGNMVVNETKESHTVTELSHNDTRYFKAFAIYNVLGEQEVSSGVSAQVAVKDITPPSKVTNISIVEDNTTLIVNFTPPMENDYMGTRLVYNTINNPVDISDGTVVSNYVSGTPISGLINDTTCYIRLFPYDNNGNYNTEVGQSIQGVPSDGDDKTGSPGPKKLIGGTMDAGYFGVVPTSELFTGTELAGLCGITEGTVQFDGFGWLKFAIDGKIIFKSQKTYRHSISWDHINSKGCVKGTKTVTKDGHTYKVRLMKGALTDPSRYDLPDRGAKGSEWNKLMLPIHIKSKDKSWAYPAYVETDIPYWGVDFTDSDLQTHRDYGDGSYQWCEEVPNDNSAYRVYRGNHGASYSDRATSSAADANFGWSPVLEWVS